MWVQPHGGPQLDPLGHGRPIGPAHGLDQLDGGRRGGLTRADADHPGHSRLRRPGQGARQLGGVRPRRHLLGGELLLEVTVRVEPLDDRLVHPVNGVAPLCLVDSGSHLPAHALRRGKSGSPFVTGRPAG